MEDLIHFMQEDEAAKTMSLFEGASETRRINKSSLKNWVVRTRFLWMKQYQCVLEPNLHINVLFGSV